MEHTAKFFVGQIVHHKNFDYRGVVFDVDATFQGTEEWYALVARSRPPKHMPCYHVLVDGSEAHVLRGRATISSPANAVSRSRIRWSRCSAASSRRGDTP